MATKIFLHIGLEKTGSTSIQHFLDSHAHDLAIHGFLYPQAGIVNHGQHNLAFAAGFSTLSADIQVYRDLGVELESWPGQVLLSSENFSINGNKQNVARLRDLLIPFAEETVILVYYRGQRDWLRSLYIERKRWGLDRDYDDFCRAVVPTYEALPALWREQFGAKSVLTRGYQKGNNVLADFTEVIGLPIPPQALEGWWLNRTPADRQAPLEVDLPDHASSCNDWGWESIEDLRSEHANG